MKNYKINSQVTSKVSGNKDIVVLLLSLVVSGSLFYIFSGPTYKSYLVLKQEIQLKQKNLANKKQLLDNIQAFNRNNKDLELNVDKLKVFVSNRNNYEDYLGQINDLAISDNLQVSSFTVDDYKKTAAAAATTTQGSAQSKDYDDKFKQKTVSFSVKGDFTNFLHFIKTLENSIPIVQEQSITVSIEQNAGPAQDASKTTIQPQQIDQYPSLTYQVSFKFVYYQQ